MLSVDRVATVYSPLQVVYLVLGSSLRRGYVSSGRVKHMTWSQLTGKVVDFVVAGIVFSWTLREVMVGYIVKMSYGW